jgi:ketosteroid isomerase-like protein
MKIYLAKFVCAMIFVGMAQAPVWSQDADESAAGSKILALEHAWNQAEAFKDLKALDALFDNALVYVDPDGTMLTKAEFLSRVKSTPLQQVVTQSMAVKFFGNTAIVTGTYRATEIKRGKTLLLEGRFVDTWVFKDSNWVCVAAQSTPLQH